MSRVYGYGSLRTSKKGKRKPKRRTRKDFKTLDGYLNDIYNENKSYLNQHIKKFGDTRKKREIFKEEVKRWMNKINPNTGKNYTVKQAIDKVQRSEIVRTREERYADIFMDRIKREKEEFNKFRKEIGWKNKIDINNIIDMTNDGNKNYIRYRDQVTGKDIIIIETISPKSGVVTEYNYEDYDTWREKYLRKHQDSAANAAELAVQSVLNRRRGK